jgi:hypothetical protein
MEKPELPKTFIDAAGRSWTVTIVWSTCKRLKDLAGVTVDGLIVKKPDKDSDALSPFLALITDFEALTGALYAVLKPDCDKLSPALSLDDFRDGIYGDVVTEARNAFAQALHDFSHGPQKAMLAGAILMGLKAEQKAQAKIPALMAAAETKLDADLAALSIDTPSNPPSSPAPASAE